jgi:hypothetical protein
MNVREATDFLVNQAAEQAAIDGVSLSDIEKRMMYFTEWDDSGGNPIALNEEVEAQYNTEQYEPKIAELLRSAHARLKNGNPSSARTWDEAVAVPSKGDHYLLVLLDHGSSKWQLLRSLSSPAIFCGSFWKVLGIGLLVLFLGIVVFVYLLHRRDSMPANQSMARTFSLPAQASCLYITSTSTNPYSG